MKIKVKESSLIGPAEETPNRHLWLSNLDQIFGLRSHVPTIYVYKPDGSSNFFQVEVLKEALSKVLVSFYPSAGRFTKDENDAFQINCNGNGALFVEVETDSTFEDLDDRTMLSEELLSLLIPKIDYSSDLSSIPPFVSQVTKFACGGVCIGFGYNHMQGDGFAALHLINSWAAIARGLDVDPPPHTDRTMLKSRVPLNPKFHHVEYEITPSMNTTTQNSDNQPDTDTASVVSETFRMTNDQLEILKAKTENKESIYEILTAHIWRCVCEARALSSDQETKLFISVDGRSRLNPPLPVGYYGNAIFHATPIASSGAILSESLISTVERINKAIKRMDDEYLRSAIDYLEQVGNLVPALAPSANGCPNLTVISWKHLPFYDADFGWGKPTLVKAGAPWEGWGALHSSGAAADEGSLFLTINLKPDHIVSFKKLFYDLWQL